MTERIDALERLQRLRELGAVSNEEFEREKAALFAPFAASETVTIVAGTRGGFPLRAWVAGGVGLLLIVVAAIQIARNGGLALFEVNAVPAAPEDSPAANQAPPAPALPSIRTRPERVQLAAAFRAAFGQSESAVVTIDSGREYAAASFIERIRYVPRHLVWTSFGAVLLSEGTVLGAAHVNAGKIAAHYLRLTGDQFELVSAYPSAVVVGSFGQVGEWAVSSDFSELPVIHARGGFTGQGITEGCSILTELRPAGPIELVAIPDSHSNAGSAVPGAEIEEVEGRITNIVKGRSFIVRYNTGEIRRYERVGDRYRRVGTPVLRHCGD